MVVRSALFMVLLAAPALANDDSVKLPPEVTPALRAACEQDVKRHCVGENPTYQQVRRCVEQKHPQFGLRCRMAIASSGLSR